MNSGNNHLFRSFLFFVFLFLLVACDTSGDQSKNSKTDNVVDTSYTDTITKTSLENEEAASDSLFVAMHNMAVPKFGDFDSLLKRRLIRVLVPYSRILFFNDKGRERGITADMFRDLEVYLNKKYKRTLKNIPLTVMLIPTPRDKLLTHLNEGLGDIAAGNLSVTEGRTAVVDFFTSDKQQPLFEIPLTRKGSDSLTNREQLSGRTIHVRRSSSYFEHLQLLNNELKSKGKPLIKLVLVAEDLEDEDLMEMLDAGILTTIVVTRWKCRMWSVILPNIHLNERAAVHSGGYIGWAVRKNSSKLIKELSDFYYKHEVPNGVVPYRLKHYAANVKQLQDPTNSDHSERYSQIIALFEKYGKQYQFDPLMLAAQGFQESRLNQNQKSSAGAIGVMQLMPATGASMRVGNVAVTEPNIHAGAKYMNILMTKYFQDAHFNAFNRSLFAFASYNAGPGRVAGLRRVAAKRGLDPNVWLNNVEIIASEKIGQETTTYVRNIMKYYYSYKLMEERHAARVRKLEAL